MYQSSYQELTNLYSVNTCSKSDECKLGQGFNCSAADFMAKLTKDIDIFT